MAKTLTTLLKGIIDKMELKHNSKKVYVHDVVMLDHIPKTYSEFITLGLSNMGGPNPRSTFQNPGAYMDKYIKLQCRTQGTWEQAENLINKVVMKLQKMRHESPILSVSLLGTIYGGSDGQNRELLSQDLVVKTRNYLLEFGD